MGAESENGATCVRTTQLSGMKRLFSSMYGSLTCASGTNVAGLRIVVQPAVARIADDADDLARRLHERRAHARADDQPLADGIVILPILLAPSPR